AGRGATTRNPILSPGVSPLRNAHVLFVIPPPAGGLVSPCPAAIGVKGDLLGMPRPGTLIPSRPTSRGQTQGSRATGPRWGRRIIEEFRALEGTIGSPTGLGVCSMATDRLNAR